MKSILIFIFCGLLTYSLQAQEPDFAWGKLIGTAGNTFVDGVTADNNGNYYIKGRTTKTINLDNNITVYCPPNTTIGFLAKFDATGMCLWAKKASFTSADSRRSMVVDNDGYIYITGFFRNGVDISDSIMPTVSNTYYGYLAVVKLDMNGDFLWCNPIANYETTSDYNQWSFRGHISICFNQKGQLFVSGNYDKQLTFYANNDTLTLQRDSSLPATEFVATYTKDGNLLQADSLPTEMTASIQYPSQTALEEIIELDAQGNIYRFTIPTGKITKYDPQLNVIASHTVSEYCTVTDNATTSHVIDNFMVDRIGDIYLTSRFRGGSNMSINTQITYHIEGFDIPKTGSKGAWDAVLTKLNGTTFAGEWFAQYIYSDDDVLNYLTTDELNNVYAAGNLTYGGGIIMKYTSNGQRIWAKRIETGTATPLTSNLNANVRVEQIFLSPDGGNILAVGFTTNRIQIDATVTEFPNVQKVFVIQYGICNTLKPDITAVPSTIFCAGDSVLLTANGSTENYIWNVGDTTTSIHTSIPITYSVIAKQDSVCYGQSAPLLLHEVPLPEVEISVTEDFILSSSVENGNQWYLNGEPIIGATAQTYTATENGDYYATVKDNNACEGQSNTIHIGSVGIASITGKNSINIYPNPASNEVNIQTDLDVSEVYVLDLQGKELQKTSSKDVNLSKLSSGIYLIKVKLKNNEVWTSKVIKN